MAPWSRGRTGGPRARLSLPSGQGLLPPPLRLLPDAPSPKRPALAPPAPRTYTQPPKSARPGPRETQVTAVRTPVAPAPWAGRPRAGRAAGQFHCASPPQGHFATRRLSRGASRAPSAGEQTEARHGPVSGATGPLVLRFAPSRVRFRARAAPRQNHEEKREAQAPRERGSSRQRKRRAATPASWGLRPALSPPARLGDALLARPKGPSGWRPGSQAPTAWVWGSSV